MCVLAGAFSGSDNETTVYNSGVSDSSNAKSWKYNGQCLACDSYTSNTNDKARIAPPTWVLDSSNSCRDCRATGDIAAGVCTKPPVPKPTKQVLRFGSDP